MDDAVTMAPAMARATAHCRACWRALAPAATQLLPCGHALCAACLAAHARAALASLASALPLRCCWAVVPVALVRDALLPAELAFYAFRTQQTVAATRARVMDAVGADLQAPCDFCMAPVRLATARDVDQALLPCGHVYCHGCVATLQEASGGAADQLCCAELSPDPAVLQDHAPPAALQLADQPAPATEPRRRVSARRTSVAPPTFPGKGKRKLQVAKPAAAATDIVDLLDDSDDLCEEKRSVPDEEEDAEDPGDVCVKCAARVDAATNRFRAACGHVFCRACLHERCLRALRNEEQGSIGVPVRCCYALVGLDLLRAVLSKRNFVKYEALVARRGTAALPTPPRATRKRKATTKAAAVDGETASTTQKKPRKDGDQDDTPAECVACMSDVPGTDRLTGPCGHVYCLECLAMMAKQSLENRALVPIRCCSQEFPIEYVKRVLNAKQFDQYNRFLKEKDWRKSDLKSDKEYAAMVRAIDGKQCPTCGVGVQKISGCDAIRCLRGHLFCFACEAAPCTCGRTRLESYGWVPPGTQPAQPPQFLQAAGVRVHFGAANNGIAHVLAAANDRLAGLVAAARGRATAAPAVAARARPKPTRAKRG